MTLYNPRLAFLIIFRIILLAFCQARVFTISLVIFQLSRLCGLTWLDFVELVDIERSGGSGVAWLSQTRSNSITQESSLIPPKNDVRTNSVVTDVTSIWSDEEDVEEVEDKIVQSTFKPVITRVSRRPKLKRAQSERVPSLDIPNSLPPTPPQSRVIEVNVKVIGNIRFL